MTCDRFEEFFTQKTQAELLEHIQSCEKCMLEYKKMLITESLVKEVKPHFTASSRKISFAKMAASLALVAVSSVVIFHNLYIPKLTYEESVSSSFPCDEYGLLDIR